LDLRNDAFPCAEIVTQCPRFYSAFITRGDNNGEHDQSSSARLSAPVRLEWVAGKARGEIPWFGLIKLALYGNGAYDPRTDPTRGANWSVLAARAPWDICLSLYLSVAVVFAAPMLIELGRRAWSGRRAR
jgi:hypothetical protein